MDIQQEQEMTEEREKIQEAFAEFLDAVSAAEQQYGEEEVLTTLSEMLPEFEL